LLCYASQKSPLPPFTKGGNTPYGQVLKVSVLNSKLATRNSKHYFILAIACAFLFSTAEMASARARINFARL